MKDKVILQLNQLRDNFSDITLKEVLDSFYDLTSNEINNICKNERELLNNQDNRFYDSLALKFIDDLNDFSLLYFGFWDSLINKAFDDKISEYFLSSAINFDAYEDATHYINGFINLKNDKPDLALFHFNQIDDYVACYFLGLSYMLSGNFENAIKNYEFFIKNMTSQLTPKQIIDYEFDILQWNIYNDLGYSFSQIGKYKQAVNYYEKSLSIFDLNEHYSIDYQYDNVSEPSEFKIFINNYLHSLDKLMEYDKMLDILNFVDSKFPNEIYSNLLTRVENKKENSSIFEYQIKNLLKPKRLKIGSFEITKLIAKEKAFEDLLFVQIKRGYKVFDRPLQVFENELIYGKQYYIKEVNGYLDLMLIDKETDVVYVVELKRDLAGIEVVEQIEKYIYGIKEEIDNEVKGIICSHNVTKELAELVKQKENIELYTYNFEFNRMV